MKKFILLSLAVFLGLASFYAYRDYSQSHVNISFRWTQDAETGEDYYGAFQAYKQWSPFANAQGIHIYWIAERYNEETKTWEPVLPIVNDQEIEESTNFIGFPGSETAPVAYTVVCTTEVLTTFQEVNDASFNEYINNSTSFVPSPGWLPSTTSLKCK